MKRATDVCLFGFLGRIFYAVSRINRLYKRGESDSARTTTQTAFDRLQLVFFFPPSFQGLSSSPSVNHHFGERELLLGLRMICNACLDSFMQCVSCLRNYIVICRALRPMRIRGKTTYSKYKKSYFWQIVPVYDIAQKSNKNYPWKFFIVLLSSSLFKSYIPHADKRAREPRSAEESSQKPKKSMKCVFSLFWANSVSLVVFQLFKKKNGVCACVRVRRPARVALLISQSDTLELVLEILLCFFSFSFSFFSSFPCFSSSFLVDEFTRVSPKWEKKKKISLLTLVLDSIEMLKLLVSNTDVVTYIFFLRNSYTDNNIQHISTNETSHMLQFFNRCVLSKRRILTVFNQVIQHRSMKL